MVDLGYFRGLGVAKRDAPSVPAAVPTVLAAGAPRRLDQAVDFSNGQIASLFVTLVIITSIPILLYPWPPLADYMNHLARMHVIATIDSDPDLSRYYEIEWQVIPNLMMDVVVPVFQRVMNIYLAGQLFTIIGFARVAGHARYSRRGKPDRDVPPPQRRADDTHCPRGCQQPVPVR